MTDWLRGVPVSRTYVSVLTLAEFDQGIAALPPGDERQERHRTGLVRVEAEFSGRVLPLSDEIVRAWGEMQGRRRLAKLGQSPVLDALLAATAVRHRLYLASRNRRDVSGLGAVVFDPWTSDPSLFPLQT